MKFDRQRLVLGFYAVVIVALAQLIADYFKLPLWPAFVVWILFFIEQMNPRKVPHIVIGAVAGMGLLMLAPLYVGLLGPSIGAQWATLTYVLLAVYAIVAIGEMIPYVLNNYAFLFLTIGAVVLQAPNPNPILWAVIAAVGGAILIAITLLVVKFAGSPITAELNTR